MNRRKAGSVRLNKYLGDIWTDIDPQGQTPFIHLVGQPAEFGDQNLDSAIFPQLEQSRQQNGGRRDPKNPPSDLYNRHRPPKIPIAYLDSKDKRVSRSED